MLHMNEQVTAKPPFFVTSLLYSTLLSHVESAAQKQNTLEATMTTFILYLLLALAIFFIVYVIILRIAKTKHKPAVKQWRVTPKVTVHRKRKSEREHAEN